MDEKKKSRGKTRKRKKLVRGKEVRLKETLEAKTRWEA